MFQIKFASNFKHDLKSFNRLKCPQHISVQTYTQSEYDPDIIEVNVDYLKKTQSMQYFRNVKKELHAPAIYLTDDDVNQKEHTFFNNFHNMRNLYVVDLEDTIFKTPIAQGTTFSFQCILRMYYGPDNPGLTRPYIYIGHEHTIFALHVENCYLYSLSYNYGPAPKVWYIIPQSELRRLEMILAQIFTEDLKQCGTFIQHKFIYPSEKFLRAHNIRFNRVIQHANEMVVLWPGAYHYGFNTGYNLAEAVNLASPEWITIADALISHDNLVKNPCTKCKQNDLIIDMDFLKKEFGVQAQFGVQAPSIIAEADGDTSTTTTTTMIVDMDTCNNHLQDESSAHPMDTTTTTENETSIEIYTSSRGDDYNHDSPPPTNICKLRLHTRLAVPSSIKCFMSRKLGCSRRSSWGCNGACLATHQRQLHFCYAKQCNCFYIHHSALYPDTHFPYFADVRGICIQCRQKTFNFCKKCNNYICHTRTRSCFYSLHPI